MMSDEMEKYARAFEKRKDENRPIVRVNNNGLGFTGSLTLLFVLLKLTGYITWSWWWVLSPIWISFAILLTVFLVAFAVIAIFSGK